MRQKQILLLIVLLITHVINLNAQNPQIIGQAKQYGGSGNEESASFYKQNDIAVLTSGAYVTVGTSASNDANVSGNHGGMFGQTLREDIWVVKHTSGNNISWQKSFGSKGKEYGHSIAPTTDGGYIVAGSVYIDTFTTAAAFGQVQGYHNINDGAFTFDGFPTYDGWVIKIDANGILQWQKCLGGTFPDEINEIRQTLDGGYIAIGYTMSNDGDLAGIKSTTSSDIYLVKLSSTGAIQWQKTLGGSGPDFGYSVLQNTDSSYVVAGTTVGASVAGNHGGNDGWVAKIDKGGTTVVWSTSIGGSGTDIFYDLQKSSSSTYVACGYTTSNNSGNVPANNGGKDAFLAKINSTGTVSFVRCYGGTNDEIANSIAVNSSNSYMMVGSTNSLTGQVTGYTGTAGGPTDIWVMKTSSSGSLTGNLCIGTATGTDDGFAIARSIAVCGTISYKYYILGKSNSSNLNFSTTHGGFDRFMSLIFDGTCNVTTMAPVTNITKNSALINWNQAVCGTGYTLQFKKATDPSWNSTLITGNGVISFQESSLLPSTTYNCRVKVNCGLNSSSYSATTTFTTLAIRLGDQQVNDATESQLSVYPNPANDIIQLNFTAETFTADVEVINTLGKVILSKQLQSDDGNFEGEINLDALSSSIYVVRVSANGRILFNSKLIKQN